MGELRIAVVAVVCGGIAVSIAQSKYWSGSRFWAGFLLGIIGQIRIAAMPALQPGQPGYQPPVRQP